MTALSAVHAGKPDLKHPDRFFAPTVRLRSEGTDHLLAAAEAIGVSHVVAQGFLLAGEMAVIMMTEGRGFSNAKAKRELGWKLRYPSWRQGFKEELA
jgi:hypothetical protein